MCLLYWTEKNVILLNTAYFIFFRSSLYLGALAKLRKRTMSFITGVLISPQPDQEGNTLQRQKILMFIYPISNHNWSNISTTYLYV